jgi:hypothetical protein
MARLEPNSKYLTAEDILSASDIHVEELPVPEWGGTLYVKTLTGEERDKIEAEILVIGADGRPKQAKLNNLRSLVAFYGICDEKGNRLFTKAEEIAKLAKKSASALDRVVARIQELSAMSPADIENLIDDLKNDQRAALPTA